ncbi:MAG: M67 family metallopeptidase [Actinomycetia bacterium]|nr:M67 family metallopeptidase [Actinomycetes bacterium]
MKLQIKQCDIDTIIAHAQAELPNEACGLVAGRVDAGGKARGGNVSVKGGYAEAKGRGAEADTDGFFVVEKVYLLSNIDQSHEHFSIDPKEQLAAIKDMRSLGLAPLGNFHSHPETPARPSEEDIRLAHDRNAVYLIVSLAAEQPVLKAFRVIDGVASAVAVEVLG